MEGRELYKETITKIAWQKQGAGSTLKIEPLYVAALFQSPAGLFVHYLSTSLFVKEHKEKISY